MVHTPVYPNKIKQNIRQLVWNTHVGQKYGTTYCFCCEVTQITPFTFECGHIDARSKGGKDSVDNLLPICGLCNRSMGTMNFKEFQKFHNLPLRKSCWIKHLIIILSIILLISYFYLYFSKYIILKIFI